MSWRAFVGRNARLVRFIVDTNEFKRGGNSFGVQLRDGAIRGGLDHAESPAHPRVLRRRLWYEKNYRLMRELNPMTPFLLRGSPFSEPTLTVEYSCVRAMVEGGGTLVVLTRLGCLRQTPEGV